MGRPRGVDEEVVAAAVSASAAAVAKVYRRRLRNVERQLAEARALVVVRDAEEVVQEAAARLLGGNDSED